MLDLLFIPEVTISIGIMFVIIVDLFLQDFKKISYFLIQIILILSAYQSLNMDYLYHYDAYELSKFSNYIKLILIVGSIIIFQYSFNHLSYIKNLKIEYFTISLLGLVGAMVMISANSLLMLYLGIELLSLSLYALIGFNKNSPLSSEAAIKYYVLGAMSSD